MAWGRAFTLVVMSMLCLLPQKAAAIGELGGSIGGFVTVKGSNLGLAGVPLTIRSKELIGGPQDTASADDGSYVFQNLPPGTYEVEVKLEGFAPIKQINIQVNAGQRASVDLALAPASSPEMNEKTTIIEKVNPVLNPQSAAAVTPVSNRTLTSSPSFRQEKGVAQYTAGVNSGGDRAVVRGGLGRFNRYFIDGLDVTDITLGAFGTSSALINSDSVEQFVVSVGAMDAEYNSLGLVQNMVTRSGGNKFIFDASVIVQPPFFASTTRYPSNTPLQNDKLLYDNRPLPDRSFYSASVNFGGPIVKDRLWFWTNFQFNYNRLTLNINEQKWYGLSEPYDRYQDQVLYLGRVKLTWQATKTTRVTLSYSLDFNDIVNAFTSSYINGANPQNLAPEAERRLKRGGHWVGLLVDSALTDRLLLQLQTGVFYKNLLEDSIHTIDGRPDRLTAAHQLETSDAATNNFLYLNSNRPWDDQSKWSAQFAPTLLYTARGLGGEHNIKGGMQLTYMHFRKNTGIAGGKSYIDYLPGLPCDADSKNTGDPRTYASCNQLTEYPMSTPSGNQPGEGFTTTAQAMNLGFFIQDRYTLKRWLTIVPGMRVDVGMLYDTNGTRLQTLVGFGPRLSLIYDLFHDHTTLLMAHYGRHNDVGNAGVADAGNPGALSTRYSFDPSLKRFAKPITSGGPGSQSFATDLNLAPPSLDEISAGIHREIVAQTVVGIDYTYRLYSNFWVNEEVNQIWDPAGQRVVGYADSEHKNQRLFVADTASNARRVYHGLDLWVRGNPGHFDLLASYTLAFLNGTVGDFFETAGYKYNPRLEPLFYGPVAGAPRHYLKGLISYGFDFGLTIGTRLQFASGAPLWKQFRSPEDRTYSLYRSTRGSDTGTRANDPTTWAEFNMPNTLTMDLQVAYNLKKLTGQNIDVIAMIFNLLNLLPPLAIESRDGPAFGTVTRRPDPLFCEMVIRYRY